MSPTWSLLTLLLLSAVLLLATWRALWRRVHMLERRRDVLAGGSRAAAAIHAQERLLAAFVGRVLLLSVLVLLAMVTVLTDSVSALWCKLHGALLHGLTLHTSALLVVLCGSVWAALLLEGREEQTREWLQIAMRWAFWAPTALSLLTLVYGSFEQQTLFCFAYRPMPLFVWLFEVPILLLATVAALLAAHSAYALLQLQHLSIVALVLACRRYRPVVQGSEKGGKVEEDDELAESITEGGAAGIGGAFTEDKDIDRGGEEEEAQEGEEEGHHHHHLQQQQQQPQQQQQRRQESKGRQRGAPKLSFPALPLDTDAEADGLHAVVPVTHLKGRLLLMALALAAAGIALVIYQITGDVKSPGSDLYYQGGDEKQQPVDKMAAAAPATAAGGQPPEAAAAAGHAHEAPVMHESELGHAVFLLSLVGALIFGTLGTHPVLWQVREEY
jgi:hypothetical protein